jgi:predicted dehydrogenase
MALDLTADQKAQGSRNFEQTTGELSRRGFMKTMVAGTAVVPVSASVYFGYQSWKGNKAVKAALIGCGDEGGVLLGEHNPEFVEFVAFCDIRPTNKERILYGDPKVALRKGVAKIYGSDYARKMGEDDKHFFTDYRRLLENKDKLGLEMVVIALPLHLHASCAIDCLEAGLHVLCEKLMARTIGQCKAMINKAREKKRLLAIGHQRHYSMLYAHANEVVESGVLGEVKHIRALWHRNNSWPFVEDKGGKKLARGVKQPDLRDGWFPAIYDEDYQALLKHPERWNKDYASIEQLIRWRLYDRTGGGLMAELGSHQLDACSIFLGKVKPLSVVGVGGRYFYGDANRPGSGPNPRESDDHVFVTYEFPGKRYFARDDKGRVLIENNKPKVADPSDIVVVTYTSVNTNGFEQYGECLMGTRGTMIVESEQNVYLFKEKDPTKRAESDARATNVTVTTGGGGKPVLDSSSTWGGPSGAVVKEGGSTAAVSRGYREEMEHFAFCVRELPDGADPYATDANGDYILAKDKRLPKCHGEVAMVDAILALTANMAMKHRTRISYEENWGWFDAANPEVPETKYGEKPV